MKISRRNFLRLSVLAICSGPLAAKLGCSIEDMNNEVPASPAVGSIEREISKYLEKNEELAPTFEMYKGIFVVHQGYLDQIQVSVPFSEEEIRDFFREGRYLLSQQQLKFDPAVFKEVMVSITRVIQEKSPENLNNLEKLFEAREFSYDNVQDFLNLFTIYDKPQMEQHIREIGMEERTGLNSELITFVTFSASSIFYNAYMEETAKITDFSLWRRGYCPVCGQTATIAKHRKEDGARILECRLCHAQWYYPRVECPYCENRDFNKLRFFFVEDDRSRQVHVCEVCRSYLKVIDGRAMGKEVNLELEDIATEFLDVLAEREGYQLPDRNLRLLN